MEDKITRLQDLFECNRYPASKIIFCNGIRKISVRFDDLQKYVSFIEESLKRLNSTNTTICILTEQGLGLPAIILGVLRVNSSFASLDVDKPLENLSAYQKLENIKTIIIQERYLKDIESELCCCWKKTDQFYVFSQYNVLQSIDCKNDACPNSKEYEKYEMQSEIAYVIQTSGTTGERKIVKVPHRCIVPNIIDLRSRFSLTVEDVILQSTLMTFDPSILEIFLSLSSGATLIMIAGHIRASPEKLLETVADNQVTVFQGTPSLMYCFGTKALKEILLSKESILRVLALNGEIFPSFTKLQQWKSDENSTEIYNLYGQTEVSCFASCFKVDFQTGASLLSIPIGEPLLNTELEIHDKNGEIADKGEIYIGGPGRFCIINNEEWPANDSIMRPTGDLAYKTSNGFIYFEGRYDDIIRYKGHKISLPQLHSIVNNFPEVENSFIHFDPTAAKLYLYIVSACDKPLDSELEQDLENRLKKLVFILPPITFLPVPFIPVTKHGKADRLKLLSLLDITVGKKSDDIISKIWKSFADQTRIIENDNYILSGSDPLTAAQFASDIECKI